MFAHRPLYIFNFYRINTSLCLSLHAIRKGKDGKEKEWRRKRGMGWDGVGFESFDQEVGPGLVCLSHRASASARRLFKTPLCSPHHDSMTRFLSHQIMSGTWNLCCWCGDDGCQDCVLFDASLLPQRRSIAQKGFPFFRASGHDSG